jgi:cytochrome c oxidase subunit 3
VIEELEHADHFASFDVQTHAARLGMWIFVASEILLFAGMFALYLGYRLHFPDGFREGVAHNLRWDGTLNTAILLLSSYLIARSIPAALDGRRRIAEALLASVLVLGCAFLCLKGYEYLVHLSEGIRPGGGTPFYREHPTPGLTEFFTLYYLMTGAHALHVTIGLLVVAGLLITVHKERVAEQAAYRLEIGAMYWHLVDLVWIFLWPLFYLTAQGGSP